MPGLPEDFLKRMERCKALPTMPGVALRIVELCRNEEVDLPEIARTLSQDPSLSAKILKFANSAYVGGRGQVRTISHATALLGLISVQTLALSFSLVSELQSGGGQIDRQRYWRRSLFAAVAARQAAHQLGAQNVEEAFVASLLQDIGILALSRVLGEEYAAIQTEADGDHEALVKLERERLGFDHATVTAFMAGEWGLPSLFTEAALASHDFLGHAAPEKQPDGWRIAQAVALSGRVADIWISPDVAVHTQRAERCASEHLQLAQPRFKQILQGVALQVEEAARLVEIQAGAPDDIQAVLEDARDSLVQLGLRNLQERHQLEDQSRRDALTGVFNRAHASASLDRLFAHARDFGDPLSLAFIDIDEFKTVNDVYGHGTGDEVVKTVAEVTSECVRGSDIVGRYGGDEFVVLLPKTTAVGARRVCERIREGVAERTARGGDASPRVTVSIGYATFDRERHTTPEALVRAADDAMYAAKWAGRNAVVAASTLPPGFRTEGRAEARSLRPSRGPAGA
jgi:diguanylate cyclase (GGDEF)-like protein